MQKNPLEWISLTEVSILRKTFGKSKNSQMCFKDGTLKVLLKFTKIFKSVTFKKTAETSLSFPNTILTYYGTFAIQIRLVNKTLLRLFEIQSYFKNIDNYTENFLIKRQAQKWKSI